MIPAPFTECIVFFGDPVYVNGKAEEEINEAWKKLEACLYGFKHQAQCVFLNVHTSR